MLIKIRGAAEHNLKNIDVDFFEGLTAVTGVSGSGKTSLVFDTLYRESQRRFREVFAYYTESKCQQPARVRNISGILPAVALGQNLLNRNPNSIVATASGLHVLFRILYAGFGTRFCHICGAEVNACSEDNIIETLRKCVFPAEISAVLLKNAPGSHQTLLRELSKYCPGKVVVDNKKLTKGNLAAGLKAEKRHTIEIVLKRYDQKEPVRVLREDLRFLKALNPASLKIRAAKEYEFNLSSGCNECGTWIPDVKPSHFNTPCPFCSWRGCRKCGGTGIHPIASGTRWNSLKINELLDKSIGDAFKLFKYFPAHTPANSRLLNEIKNRLEALNAVGLKYIQLNRPSPSLSRGEAQRLRTAVALICKLEDMLHVLDEPTIGQHPYNVAGLINTFRELKGPVIFIEHDRIAVSEADRCLDLGPEAGSNGGEIVFRGSPEELLKSDTLTGRYLTCNHSRGIRYQRKPPEEYLEFKSIFARNLKNISIKIPVKSFTVITGVSGSGKSSLVEEVIVKSLLNRSPTGCRDTEGPYLKPVYINQDPLGKNRRSNPATYTKTSEFIRDFFASHTDLSPSYFSFNRPEGSCSSCNGLGSLQVILKYLPELWITCSACGGRKFSDEVLDRKVKLNNVSYSIADIYEMPIIDLYGLFENHTGDKKLRENILRQIKALIEVGLGYLSLGQESPTLSGGEAQRVKLAKYLGKKDLADKIIILDEPTTGLHPKDVRVLRSVFENLILNGASIAAVEHNTDIIRSADWIIDLGPGAGPEGGELVFQGLLEGIIDYQKSFTGLALASEFSPRKKKKNSKSTDYNPNITLKNVGTNNLKNVSVSFKKGSLNVVTGVSGSGKSSLVKDTLEKEARKRFLESLTMYERQNTNEKPGGHADELIGLGLAVSIGSEQKVHSIRASVGSVTGITNHLAVIFSFFGKKVCPACGRQFERQEKWICRNCGLAEEIPKPRHFLPDNYYAACTKCHGLGTLRKPNPSKLIIDPDKPLCRGAMYSPGFFPKGYLGKPYNAGYDLLQGLARVYSFDPFNTPWNKMTREAQNTFLYGSDKKFPVTFINRKGRQRRSICTFTGFYKWVGDWDQGGTYTDTEICPACRGSKLKKRFSEITVADRSFFECHTMPLTELYHHFKDITDRGSYRDIIHTNIKDAKAKIKFLIEIGLGYINLNRQSRTLSAGEAQRIRIAAMLGNNLTGITVILDEPSRGMHPAEVNSLADCFAQLTKNGNTLVVIEHDPEIIGKADYIIDMGPGSGKNGGRVIARGTPQEIIEENTLTGLWLKNHRPYFRANFTPKISKKWMTIRGAYGNNLKIDKLSIPLNMLTGICGVSGSGKSSLIVDTIGRILAPKKHTTSVAREEITPGKYSSLEGRPENTIVIDQSKEGVSSPARFMGLKSLFEKMYGESHACEMAGFSPELFRKRCSSCKGRGRIVYNMSFLPDARVRCSACRGTGYLSEVFGIVIKEYTLPELLSLTIAEIYELWKDSPRVEPQLAALITVGLGYLALNQKNLSGGEAGRLKIAYHLSKKNRGGSTLFIIDEPTVGLHMDDTASFIKTMHAIVARGNSIIVVEHNPLVLASCDYLIELGPEGGPRGGRVIAAGTPLEVAKMKTPSSVYLSEYVGS